MAELFGLAAAGVGLAPVALELAKTIKKLRDYCRSVKYAQRDIQNFVHEVDAVHTVLLELQSVITHDSSSGSQGLLRCHGLCVEAHNSLHSVVSDLQQGLETHRRRTKLLFPFKQETIQQLTEKVTSAKGSLALACSVFLISQTVVQQSLLVEIFATVKSQKADTRDPSEEITPMITYPSNEATSGMWRALSCVASFGWKRAFRLQRVVGDCWCEDSAFRAAYKGDLVSLQHLLCTGKATMDDRLSGGCGILEFAILSRQAGIVGWLLQMGAARTDLRTLSGIVYGLTYPYRFRRLLHVNKMSVETRFLINKLELEIKLELLMPAGPGRDCMLALLQTLSRPVEDWTVEDIHGIALRFLNPAVMNRDLTFLKSLLALVGAEKWHGAVWRYRQPGGRTLMHSLANAYLLCDWSDAGGCGPVLREYLRHAITNGAKVCSLFGRPRNAQRQSNVCASCTYDDKFFLSASTEGAMRLWLEDLATGGVDIQRYGEREARLLRSPQQRQRYFPAVYGVAVGRHPEDWTLYWEQPGDRYTRMFWRMLESPVRTLPGAWPTQNLRAPWMDFYFGQNAGRKRARKCRGREADKQRRKEGGKLAMGPAKLDDHANRHRV